MFEYSRQKSAGAKLSIFYRKNSNSLELIFFNARKKTWKFKWDIFFVIFKHSLVCSTFF